MKRKLLCIAVAIIMILPLAFAAIPMASAAVADGWIYNDDASRYRVNTDGSLSISYNAAGVSWANLGAGYDASAFNNNYTLTVDVFIPAYSTGEVAGAPAVTTPTPVISVKAAQVSPLDPNYNWVGNGIIVKFADYQGRVSEDMYTAWGNTWKVAELFAQDAALADCVNPNFSTLGFEAGEWATYKAVVDGNKVTIYINDVLFCNSYVDETAAGNYIWLGTNGDDWNWDNAPSFRNFKIVSNDGSVADYEAYTYVEPVDPNSVNWTDKVAAAGMTAGTVSYDANGNLILANPAGWWAQSGTGFDHKVKVDGLKIAFNLAAFEYAGVFGVNSYFAVTVHQSPIGDFGIGALVGARAYSLCPVDANGFQASFGGSGLGLFIDALGGSADFQSAYNVVAGEDSTLEFKVEEGFIKFYVNGTKVTFFDEDLGEVVDYAVDATNILDEDGKAYLAFSLVCEGSIGNSQGVTIKSVNGVTTGHYKAETTYADHKATTPVVQWRAPSDNVAAGLRFKTTVALNGVNNNDSIVKMGTIIMPADKVTGGYLGHTADGKIDGTSYLDIVAKNYYEKTNDSISFTAVLIGIPEDQLDRIFLAVSYIEYADGTITYGGLRAISINGAMAA